MINIVSGWVKKVRKMKGTYDTGRHTVSVAVESKHIDRMTKDKADTGISVSEIVNRGIELYYQNEDSPSLLRSRAEKLVDDALGHISHALKLEYPDAEKEEIARKLIGEYFSIKMKSSKLKRLHYIDVNFQRELDDFLMKSVVNSDILFPKAKELAKEVWYGYWDRQVMEPVKVSPISEKTVS